MGCKRTGSLAETGGWDMLRDVGEQVKRFVSERLRDGNWPESPWTPALDLIESEDAFTLEADMPGMSRDALELVVAGDMLTIKGTRTPDHNASEETFRCRERRFGPFERSFQLPARIQEDGVKAKLENGVLLVTLPKAEPASPQSVRVEVH